MTLKFMGTKMKVLLSIISFLCVVVVSAQVSINTLTPSTSAMLHLEAQNFETITFGGYLMPVVTNDQQLAIPVSTSDARDEGLMVYVSDDRIQKYCWDVYDSTSNVWRSINCNTVLTSNENPQAPAIALIKTGLYNDTNNDSAAQVGETITYTFRVFNTGNVALDNISLSDPLLGGVIAGPASGDVDGDNVLDLNELWTYTATYTVTAIDVSRGFVVNQATVTGDDPTNVQVSDLSDNSSQNGNSPTVVALPEDVPPICDTVIYTEDFSAYTLNTGRNRRTNSGDYPAGVSWTIDDTGTDAFGQDNDYAYTNASEEFEIDNTDGPVILTFAPVDISGFATVCFSVDIRGIGDLEYNTTKHGQEGTTADNENDYINVEYSTNGGATFNLVRNFNGFGNANHTIIAQFADGTVTVENLSGTSLVIRISGQTWAADESYFYDNIIVQGGN